MPNSDSLREIAAKALHSHACTVGCELDRGGDCNVTVGAAPEDYEAADRLLADLDQAATQADQAYADKLLAETGLAGMDIHEGDARLRLVLAHELAARMTLAFKTILDAHPGAENYVEQEVIERNGGGRYVFIVCKPTGKTPHQLRREAEAERDSLRAQLDAGGGPDA